MSTVDPGKKYVTLDGVRVSYRPKDDSIHITSTDPDVAPGGFHLNLGKGTQTEETLRDLLTESGIIGGGLGKADLGYLVTNPPYRVEVGEVRDLDANEYLVDRKDLTFSDADVAATGGPTITVSTESKGGSGKTPAAFLGRRKRGLVLSLASGKGGVGRTSLALMIGSLIAKTKLKNDKRLKVIVVDMDIADPGLGLAAGVLQPTALWYATRPEDGLSQAIAHERELEIDLLLSPHGRGREERMQLLSQGFYRAVLNQLAGEYDVVILDNSVRYPDPYTSLSWEIADAILYVTDLGIGSVYSMSAWMTEQKDVQGDLDKVGVIVNKSMRDVGVDRDLIKGAARGAVLLGAVPLDTKHIHKAINYNRLEETLDSDNEVSAAVWNLIRRIMPEDVMPKLTWRERANQMHD